MTIDTHLTFGDVFVTAFGAAIVAAGAIWYQLMKRKQARRHAARTVEFPAAE